MIYDSQEQAQEACREWQERLFLRDWDVKVKIVRAREMNTDGQAEVHYKHAKRMAYIYLLDLIDYDVQLWEQDHEISLVHELLHLHFMEFDAISETPQDDAQERAIDAISKALVALKRAGE